MIFYKCVYIGKEVLILYAYMQIYVYKTSDAYSSIQCQKKKNNEKLSLVAELLAFMLTISLSHTAWKERPKKKGKHVEELQEKPASD